MTSFSTLQMISYKFNPYVSDSSSQRIRSRVVSLVLKDDTGKAFNTTDLPSDIEIDIPISKYYLEDSTRSNHFLNPGRMQYHVITVREVNTTMKITITTKATAYITVYVKFAEQPTETSYDKEIPLSDEKRLNSRNNESKFRGICSHSIVIKCIHTGKYYVGLWENSESRTELSKSKGRRSILPKQATREKCVKFKDPPSTVAPQVDYIRLAPPYDSERSVNYSLQVETIWCAFWSDTQQRWTSKGCKVRKIQRKHGMTMKCFPYRVTEVFKILIFSHRNVLEIKRGDLKNFMYSVCEPQCLEATKTATTKFLISFIQRQDTKVILLCKHRLAQKPHNLYSKMGNRHRQWLDAQNNHRS